jgi:hypothetical protein
VDDYVNAGSATSLDDIEAQSGEGFTVSAWIMPTGSHAQNEGYIIGKNWDEVGFWRIYTNSGTGFIVFDKDYSSTNLSAASPDNILPMNTWTNIVITWDGTPTGILLYKNGSSVSWVPTGGTGLKQSDASLSLTIGDMPAYNHAFNGLIDEVRLYNRPLSLDEVENIYRWAPGPSTHIRMDEKISGNSQTLYDSSGYQRNATTEQRSNASGMNCILRGKYGSSCELDGTDDYIQINDFDY